MWCVKCNKELYECECPDIEERMRSLMRNPTIAPAVIANMERRNEEKVRRNYEKEDKENSK